MAHSLFTAFLQRLAVELVRPVGAQCVAQLHDHPGSAVHRDGPGLETRLFASGNVLVARGRSVGSNPAPTFPAFGVSARGKRRRLYLSHCGSFSNSQIFSSGCRWRTRAAWRPRTNTSAARARVL